MCKYLNRIIGLVLLTILTSNCDNSKSSVHTTGEKVTLAQLAKKLEDGPILIGENHLKPFAREAIKQLIKAKKVKKLFLELPNFEKSTLSGEPNDTIISDYLASTNRTKDAFLETNLLGMFEGKEKISRGTENKSRISDLLAAALLEKDVAIYLHDVPNEDVSVQFSNSKKHPVKDRNIYSQGIIESHIKSGGKGVLILAGNDHLDPKEVGEEYTLQHLLKISNDRVFDLRTEHIE